LYRNDPLRRQGGYTLVEMMIVLLISMTLLFFASFSISPFHNSLIKSSFISQLKADLYFLQSYAINKKEMVTLQFYPFIGKYSGSVKGGETLLERELPEGVSQLPNSMNSITFYPNGNTDRFGSINYFAGDDVIKLSFQIGQGRFHVEE
jgi:competence protein ComGD